VKKSKQGKLKMPYAVVARALACAFEFLGCPTTHAGPYRQVMARWSSQDKITGDAEARVETGLRPGGAN